MKASTQQSRRSIIERFRAEHGSKLLKGLQRKHVQQIIADKSDTPQGANNLLKALRVILAYAVDQEMITNNPAVGVKKYKSQGDGYHSWSEAEIAQFECIIRWARRRGWRWCLASTLHSARAM